MQYLHAELRLEGLAVIVRPASYRRQAGGRRAFATGPARGTGTDSRKKSPGALTRAGSVVGLSLSPEENWADTKRFPNQTVNRLVELMLASAGVTCPSGQGR